MAIGVARERAATEMVLWSDTRFVHAHRLYERMGFTRNGARRLDDINNTTEFRFTMPLA